MTQPFPSGIHETPANQGLDGGGGNRTRERFPSVGWVYLITDGLRDRDWIAFRAPASLGVADVVALKAGERPRLVEVKSTAQGPYERFVPADREKLRLAGELAGADVFLVWWPPRGAMRWIPQTEWPATKVFVCPDPEQAWIADQRDRLR